jgi:ribosomal protein L11 methyltransferase
LNDRKGDPLHFGESYSPFAIGSRFRIRHPDSPSSRDGRLDLVVARGAFGSGEHETTRSCLELLEDLDDLDDLAQAEVLDLGAGTGILAIASLLLGARHALLIDNDPSAVEAARRHCVLNGVEDRVTILSGGLARMGPARFDLILANIHADILLEAGPELVRRAKPGARLVLSGILWEHNWDVRALYAELGCEMLKNCFLDEYSTLLLVRGA